MVKATLKEQLDDLQKRVELLENDNEILAHQALNYKLAALNNDRASDDEFQMAQKLIHVCGNTLRDIERIAAVVPPPHGIELRRILRDARRELHDITGE